MNYKIVGEPLPAVICDLDSGEALITESGAMSWMTPNMKMETTSNGGIGKALGRMFSGIPFFRTDTLPRAVRVKLPLPPVFPVPSKSLISPQERK